MIARFARTAVLTLVGFACAVPAQANWLKDAAHCIARDTKRRNCWPQPFAGTDRYSVRAPFCTMVCNGWERQNTLGGHQFDPHSGELNEAGRLKVHWIVTQAPTHHRSIFVYNPGDAEQTAKRIDEVQKIAAQMAQHGNLPPVLETNKPAAGWSAVNVDRVFRAWERSEMPPRIPYLEMDFNTSDE